VREKAATLGAPASGWRRRWRGGRDRARLARRRRRARAPALAAPTRGLARAEAARQTLLDPREAVGLRHHRDMDVQFPRPPGRL